jgi:hypothetical protein
MSSSESLPLHSSSRLYISSGGGYPASHKSEPPHALRASLARACSERGSASSENGWQSRSPGGPPGRQPGLGDPGGHRLRRRVHLHADADHSVRLRRAPQATQGAQATAWLPRP